MHIWMEFFSNLRNWSTGTYFFKLKIKSSKLQMIFSCNLCRFLRKKIINCCANVTIQGKDEAIQAIKENVEDPMLQVLIQIWMSFKGLKQILNDKCRHHLFLKDLFFWQISFKLQLIFASSELLGDILPFLLLVHISTNWGIKPKQLLLMEIKFMKNWLNFSRRII